MYTVQHTALESATVTVRLRDRESSQRRLPPQASGASQEPHLANVIYISPLEGKPTWFEFPATSSRIAYTVYCILLLDRSSDRWIHDSGATLHASWMTWLRWDHARQGLGLGPRPGPV